MDIRRLPSPTGGTRQGYTFTLSSGLVRYADHSSSREGYNKQNLLIQYDVLSWVVGMVSFFLSQLLFSRFGPVEKTMILGCDGATLPTINIVVLRPKLWHHLSTIAGSI